MRIHDGVLSDAEVQINFSAGPDALPPPDHLNLNVELVGNDLEISWDSQPGKLYNLRSEEHTSELQSRRNLVCRLLLEKKKHPHPPSTP